jgi:hypothetical protein
MLIRAFLALLDATGERIQLQAAVLQLLHSSVQKYTVAVGGRRVPRLKGIAARVIGGHSFVDKSGVGIFQLGLDNRVDEVEGTSALVPYDLAVLVETVAVRNHTAYHALLVKEPRIPPTAARLLPKKAKHSASPFSVCKSRSVGSAEFFF